jgi:hypothetical protein
MPSRDLYHLTSILEVFALLPRMNVKEYDGLAFEKGIMSHM